MSATALLREALDHLDAADNLIADDTLTPNGRARARYLIAEAVERITAATLTERTEQ